MVNRYLLLVQSGCLRLVECSQHQWAYMERVTDFRRNDTSTDVIRVVVAEDEELIRKALCLLVGSFEGVAVVGEAADGAEAVRLARSLIPDVVLMDLLMPVMNGVTATSTIKKTHPAIKIIALTAVARGPEIAAGLTAGLDGYVLKSAKPEELRRAIETTAAGGRYISPSISAAIAEVVKKIARPDAADRRHISARERQVVDLLSQGCRAKEIASRLGISVRTVEKHRDNLRRKYGADTVAQVVAAYFCEAQGRGDGD